MAPELNDKAPVADLSDNFEGSVEEKPQEMKMADLGKFQNREASSKKDNEIPSSLESDFDHPIEGLSFAAIGGSALVGLISAFAGPIPLGVAVAGVVMGVAGVIRLRKDLFPSLFKTPSAG